MRYNEILSEAKGLFGRKLDDVFVNDSGDEIKFKSIDIFPSINAGDQFPDEKSMLAALIKASAGQDLESVNTKKKNDLSFAIANLEWDDGSKETWVKFFNRVPKSLVGSWRNNETPHGWKLSTKTATKARSGFDPQTLIKTSAALKGPDAIIATVAKNGAAPEIIEGLKMAANGQMPVFKGQKENLQAIRDMLGEIIQPLAVMSGLIRGDIEKARSNILGAPWNQCTVSFPQSRIKGLTDSEIKNPDNGATIGISSKGAHGADASIGNIYAAIKANMNNKELIEEHAETVRLVTQLATTTAAEGPIKLCEELDLIPPELGTEIRRYLKIRTTDASQLSPKAQTLFSSFRSVSNTPGYSVGLVLLANAAKMLANHINSNGDFSKGCMAFLNQASIVQIYSSAVVKGEDVVFVGFRSVYPPNFTGTVKATAGKTYTSSQIKGKITFSL
jgi:hypothetical protein